MVLRVSPKRGTNGRTTIGLARLAEPDARNCPSVRRGNLPMTVRRTCTNLMLRPQLIGEVPNPLQGTKKYRARPRWRIARYQFLF